MEQKDQIQKLIDRFYKIISGKAGENRNWDEFRTLFHSNAQLVPMRYSESKDCTAVAYDVNSYIAMLRGFLENNDFYEFGFDYQIEIHGNIAQVTGRYEARKSIDDKSPIKSGTNLVQVLFNGGSWQIISMLWQDDPFFP